MKLKTATATPNSTGTKERIDVNGETFVKAAPAGRWHYVALVTIPGEWYGDEEARHFIGKSRTLEAAHKWTPFTMSSTYYNIPGTHYAEAYAEAVRAGGGRKTIKQGRSVYVVPTPFTRQVLKIER